MCLEWLGLESSETNTLVFEANIEKCEELHTMLEMMNEQTEGFLQQTDHACAGARVTVYQRMGIKFVLTDDWNGNARIFVHPSNFDALNEYVTSLEIPAPGASTNGFGFGQPSNSTFVSGPPPAFGSTSNDE